MKHAVIAQLKRLIKVYWAFPRSTESRERIRALVKKIREVKSYE